MILLVQLCTLLLFTATLVILSHQITAWPYTYRIPVSLRRITLHIDSCSSAQVYRYVCQTDTYSHMQHHISLVEHIMEPGQPWERTSSSANLNFQSSPADPIATPLCSKTVLKYKKRARICTLEQRTPLHFFQYSALIYQNKVLMNLNSALLYCNRSLLHQSCSLLYQKARALMYYYLLENPNVLQKRANVL